MPFQTTQWAYFLSILNDDATISIHNNLHLPMGARIVEFKHTNIASKLQLPLDIPIERHAWVRIRDPNTDKRKLYHESKQTLQWILTSLFTPSFLHPTQSIVISPLMQLQMLLPQTTQWLLEVGLQYNHPHIGSVKFKTKTIFRHIFRFPTNFRDTLPHGKPWLSFVSS